MPLGLVADLERELLRLEPLGHCPQLDVGDDRELLLVEAVEYDRVVDAVEELRPEMRLQLGLDFLLHVQTVGAVRFAVEKMFLNDMRADVAGHDDDGVAEVDRAALAIGKPPIIEYLQENVEDIRVGLLDFVEQHHAVRLAPDGLAELSTLLVADVARRRADEPRNGVFLHVLAHVDADHRRFVVEQKLGQCAGELGLADAGWPHENE